MAPTRIARKQRRSPKTDSQEKDSVDSSDSGSGSRLKLGG